MVWTNVHVLWSWLVSFRAVCAEMPKARQKSKRRAVLPQLVLDDELEGRLVDKLLARRTDSGQILAVSPDWTQDSPPPAHDGWVPHPHLQLHKFQLCNRRCLLILPLASRCRRPWTCLLPSKVTRRSAQGLDRVPCRVPPVSLRVWTLCQCMCWRPGGRSYGKCWGNFSAYVSEIHDNPVLPVTLNYCLHCSRLVMRRARLRRMHQV